MIALLLAAAVGSSTTTVPSAVVVLPGRTTGASEVRAFGLGRAIERSLRDRGVEPLVLSRETVVAVDGCGGAAGCIAKQLATLGPAIIVAPSLADAPRTPLPGEGPRFADACLARVAVVVGDAPVDVFEAPIDPCFAENLRVVGRELAGKLARLVPRAAPARTLDLTSLRIAEVDIERIPDIELWRQPDRLPPPPPRKEGDPEPEPPEPPLPVQEAIDLYERDRVRIIEDEDRHVLVYRGRRLLDDCELMRAAKRDVPRALQKRCTGNLWELGLLSVPVGALMVGFSAPTLVEEQIISFPLISGALLAIAGAGLYLALDEDAQDVAAGAHFLSRATLYTLAVDANDALLAAHDITRAEVELAREFAAR